MADTSLNPQQLFKQWRDGDATAGQAMAQRFSDWYYAVTAARLGDQNGRGPLQRACTRFQQGITGVESAQLADWAHKIVAEEISTAGGRIPGGDFPNVLTKAESPTAILRKVKATLSNEQVRLLSHAYDSTFPIEQVAREAELMGGMPYAVLQARYQLKRVLRDQHGIAFAEVPEKPNLDYAPLPLYEAGRMSNPAEEDGFEKWLLTNMSLCKDIAEFGVFALALRAGALAGDAEPIAARPGPTPRPVPTATPVAAPSAASPARPAPAAPPPGDDPFADPSESSGMGMGMVALIVLGAGGLLLALLVVAFIAWQMLG